MARHEIEHKSDRQKHVARQKATRGEPQWRNAFGCLRDGSRTDPATAPLVKQAYESILRRVWSLFALGWFWADPVVALLIAAVAVREGGEA